LNSQNIAHSGPTKEFGRLRIRNRGNEETRPPKLYESPGAVASRKNCEDMFVLSMDEAVPPLPL
jgi:hypothetical protein